MNSHRSKQDYLSSPQRVCSDLSYLSMQSQSDLRYGQDANTTLSLDPPPLLGLFNPSSLSVTTPTYSHDNSTFYQQPHSMFPAIDVRSRLSSQASPSTDMATAPEQSYSRPSALPLPVQQHTPRTMSVRDQYAGIVPLQSRIPGHISRSPSLPGSMMRERRQSSSPSPHTHTPASSGPTDGQENQALPLFPIQTYGSLSYVDPSGATSGTPVTIDLLGIMCKNLFYTEGAWTCYRRNYMSCTCSYSLSPSYPGVNLQFTPTGETQPYAVYGLSVCISAMVADSEHHNVELKLHTPKRDKGPRFDPEKVPLAPKPQNGQQSLGFYSDGSITGARSMYHDAFGNVSGAQGQALQTEHTYERIQFRSATQNNGKRRAAQQFFHLVVELWADVGSQRNDRCIKIATRKSHKMIVRGRSPGHYSQANKSGQGNQHNGNQHHGNQQPPPPPGTGFYSGYGSNVGDWAPAPLSGNTQSLYHHTYEPRGTSFGNDHRVQDVTADLGGIYHDDSKVLDPAKSAYPSFHSSVYDHSSDRVELFHAPHEPAHHSIIPPIEHYDKMKDDRDEDKYYALDPRGMGRFMAGRSSMIDGQPHLSALQCQDRRSQYAS